MTQILASIDIGSKNPCLYVEETDIDLLHTIKNVLQKARYNKDRTPTPQFTSVLEQVYKNGKCIYLDKFDISDKKYNKDKIVYNMLEYLESKIDYFNKCDVIVIEEQKKEASMNKLLEHTCYIFFIYKYGGNKPVILFPSRYKTQVLGMCKVDKKMKAYQKKKLRKEWSCKKAIEILQLRDDEKTELMILKDKKRDDYSDTITQLQAFKYKCYIDKNL